MYDRIFLKKYQKNTEKKESSRHLDYNPVDYGEMSEEGYENEKGE